MAGKSPTVRPVKDEQLQYQLQYLTRPSATNLYSHRLPPHQETEHAQPEARLGAHHPRTPIDAHWPNPFPMAVTENLGQYHGLSTKYHGTNAVEAQQYHYQEPQDSVGLGIQYGQQVHPLGYQPKHDPAKVEQDDIGRHGFVHDDVHVQSPQIQSPPTPTASDYSVTRRTRSGRALGRREIPLAAGGISQDSGRVIKSPPSKKTIRALKKEKPRTPRITAPLSELTKDYAHIPIRNMEEWVNRPAEVRWQEVEKRKGYVTRPMNSFMLYRSAYAERTKIWCLQNNHQVVSSVSGESWPLEPAEIRDRYNEYARIERGNHQLAHPGYKFSPSKPNNSKKRKPTSSEAEGTEGSELEELETEFEIDDARHGQSKISKRSTRASNNVAQAGLRTRPVQPGAGAHQSSYDTINPGKAMANMMEPYDIYSHYYQTGVHPSFLAPFVEDVRMQRTEMHDSFQPEYHGLVGLPGAAHQGLYPDADNYMPHDEQLVDPLLLSPTENPSGPAISGSFGHGHGASFPGLSSAYGEEGRMENQLADAGTSSQHAAGLHLREDFHHHPSMHLASELLAPPQGYLDQHGQWPPGLDVASDLEKWYGS